ncbi:hypothetical protein A5886_002171 [Enterococcus sp. 8G7_MSG3316]|uniref:Uncharacterized protein n=1 Tax=Candidatus Enterococcus testudinis TaxID=1834191 RepID=A0A242A8N6_9ENTE|nr:hypothetical protein A5886_002171 [Enterococcus sp. 8G7_MSG3316]
MTVAMFMFIGFVAVVFIGVIIGKSIDESEDKYIGKD